MQAPSIQDANEDYIFLQTVFKAILLETEIIPALLSIFFKHYKIGLKPNSLPLNDNYLSQGVICAISLYFILAM